MIIMIIIDVRGNQGHTLCKTDEIIYNKNSRKKNVKQSGINYIFNQFLMAYNNEKINIITSSSSLAGYDTGSGSGLMILVFIGVKYIFMT